MNTPERTYAGQQDLFLGTDDRVTRITPASRAARGVNQYRYLDLFSFAVLLGCRWNGVTIIGSKGAEGHLRLAASYGKGVTLSLCTSIRIHMAGASRRIFTLPTAPTAKSISDDALIKFRRLVRRVPQESEWKGAFGHSQLNSQFPLPLIRVRHTRFNSL